MLIVLNAKSKVLDKLFTCRIVDPIFFNNTVNSQLYVTELLQLIVAQLTEEEREYNYIFQQDDATAHIS